MKVALIQLNSSDDPVENTSVVGDYVQQAADQGAELILTPEVTNCVSTSRRHQAEVLHRQDDDPTLAALRDLTQRAGVWCLIGSLTIKTNHSDGRFANRSFLIGPDGRIAAWYDKIHMFDVQVSETETYRESEGYRPGGRGVLAHVGNIMLGLTVCYDLRFPYLYRTLAQQGAQILTVPSAFSAVTGAAHWETLLRARAIETGAFILAPAQTGTHFTTSSTARSTYGHSLIVGPWGDIIADAGTAPGVIYANLNLSEVDDARRCIMSWQSEEKFKDPV